MDAGEARRQTANAIVALGGAAEIARAKRSEELLRAVDYEVGLASRMGRSQAELRLWPGEDELADSIRHVMFLRGFKVDPTNDGGCPVLHIFW